VPGQEVNNKESVVLKLALEKRIEYVYEKHRNVKGFDRTINLKR
jgi:hypothetical protein